MALFTICSTLFGGLLAAFWALLTKKGLSNLASPLLVYPAMLRWGSQEGCLSQCRFCNSAVFAKGVPPGEVLGESRAFDFFSILLTLICLLRNLLMLRCSLNSPARSHALSYKSCSLSCSSEPQRGAFRLIVGGTLRWLLQPLGGAKICSSSIAVTVKWNISRCITFQRG